MARTASAAASPALVAAAWSTPPPQYARPDRSGSRLRTPTLPQKSAQKSRKPMRRHSSLPPARPFRASSCSAARASPKAARTSWGREGHLAKCSLPTADRADDTADTEAG